MKKTIYNIELHEKLNLDEHSYVLRVASGWIYTQCYYYGRNARQDMRDTFVPYVPEGTDTPIKPEDLPY